jgi:hypothetical protein
MASSLNVYELHAKDNKFEIMIDLVEPTSFKVFSKMLSGFLLHLHFNIHPSKNARHYKYTHQTTATLTNGFEHFYQ